MCTVKMLQRWLLGFSLPSATAVEQSACESLLVKPVRTQMTNNARERGSHPRRTHTPKNNLSERRYPPVGKEEPAIV